MDEGMEGWKDGQTDLRVDGLVDACMVFGLSGWKDWLAAGSVGRWWLG